MTETARPGPYMCTCNPSYGQSCRDCDGTAAEEREAWRDSQLAARAASPLTPMTSEEAFRVWLNCLPEESRRMWQ